MSFFRRADIMVRIACRDTTLAVPGRDVLLDACEAGQRRRLQACLTAQGVDAPAWSVQWQQAAGDTLRPNDVVAVLRGEGVAVELASRYKSLLAETIVSPGTRVAAGMPIARLERRAKPAAAPERPSNDILRQFVARQRRDAETIAALRAEIIGLRAGRTSGPAAPADSKFKRLKHEFSKRYHPDARMPGDTDRRMRERMFQEFWPIVEEIERS